MGSLRGAKVPNRLRDIRIARKLSQEQLAERAGTTHATISRLESVDQALSDKWLRRLAPILQATPGQILGIEPPEPVAWAPLIEWEEVIPLLSGDAPSVPTAGRERVATQYGPMTIVAIKVTRNVMNMVAPPGCYVIVDYSLRTLIDGKYYILNNDGEQVFRKYNASPEHFSALTTMQPPPTILLPGPRVRVVGRVVQIIHNV